MDFKSKYNAKQLRNMSVNIKERNSVKRNPIYLIVDNVLDTYNVGAIFRLADAVGASKVYLCDQTEIPPNTRIKKASINTTEWVDWEYKKSTMDAIKDLRKNVKNIRIIAVEQDKNSKPYDKIDYTMPVALIAGHETDGVNREVLDQCDEIAEIPMYGVNKSMNVMVSFGIVMFEAAKSLRK